MERFKSSILSTEVEAHLSIIKILKEELRRDTEPKSVRRTLVIGLIYGPRANKQFDIVF